MRKGTAHLLWKHLLESLFISVLFSIAFTALFVLPGCSQPRYDWLQTAQVDVAKGDLYGER